MYNKHERSDIGEIKWGDILEVDFGETKGSEQGGIRPALVVQNNKGNKFSSTIKVVPMTAQVKKFLPTHVVAKPEDTGLEKTSILLFEQDRTIDKVRILKRKGRIKENLLDAILKALTISFGISYNGNVALDFN